MGRRHRFHIRRGGAADAGCLTVLAAQVWLHTYATDGISPVIADMCSRTSRQRTTRSCCATPPRTCSWPCTPTTWWGSPSSSSTRRVPTSPTCRPSCRRSTSRRTSSAKASARGCWRLRGLGPPQGPQPPVAHCECHQQPGHRVLRSERLHQNRHGVFHPGHRAPRKPCARRPRRLNPSVPGTGSRRTRDELSPYGDNLPPC